MATSAALLSGLFLAIVLTATADDAFVERQTTEGTVRGKVIRVLNKTVEEYLGIPFAEPPVGKLRFRPPLPKRPWKGTVDATAGNTACSQVLLDGITLGNLSFTEDCLQLNVWVPEVATNPGSRRPVLVWIHGGAFTFGSANMANTSGVVLAALRDVVVVSMNYRLGILGFMNANSPEAPGNVGLLDQNMALKWVQRNIAHFGGDPERVTLFGESSGSISIHAQIMSPLSQGLFNRAVLMSGTMYNLDTWDTVPESMMKANRVANLVACSNGGTTELSSNAEEIVDCMRNKSADELVKAALEVAAPKVAPFAPTYHNEFLPRNPLVALKRGFFSSVDVLAGVTSDEGAALLLFPLVPELLEEDLQATSPEELVKYLRRALWRLLKDDIPDIIETYTEEAPKDDKNALRRQYIDYMSGRLFNCPLQFFAEKHSEKDNKVFTYVFAHKAATLPLPGWMGAPHGTDVAFAFGHPYAANPDSPDGRMAVAFVRMLASFGENGIPELPHNEAWPQYSKNSPSIVVLNNGEFNETQGFRSSYCERWRPLY
ncbi:acetylcholinesterase-like isoform X1 [Dermacentor andersoni]|uniref:acetylcholinesterase-like isoform X1 n=1 Tax=Dermacentor andersoni TaxID=34620 RepID=UPI00215553C2|nr:acetylcholinesterase-like isoform X1 [Dermacentor andersoni]